MKQVELSTNLPSEIIIEILSRLPVRTILICKCVCKSWLNLVNSPEFVNFHLSKSKPGLLVNLRDDRTSPLFQIIEFEDSLDLKRLKLYYKPITKFDLKAFTNLPHASGQIQGSANGLLCLIVMNTQSSSHIICNPITHEYIELPIPEESLYYYHSVVAYGFGVSKMSGHPKVVRILQDCIYDPRTCKLLSITKSVCEVYTVGTGSWRSIAPDGAPVEYNCRSTGAFLNGNLHWLVGDIEGCDWISCFDLETELFSTFSTPPGRFSGKLVALGNYLCFSDNTFDDEIVIWLMKEYGVDKSWTKAFVISRITNFAGQYHEVLYPIKVFKSGDLMMASDQNRLYYYSDKTKTTTRMGMFKLPNSDNHAMLHSPSFLSLKGFAMENAKSF